ncbi:MAG: hypothetical protein QGF59_32285 [Pirellulaceae bacterium]|jgi:hypothetical protein|nr:hypothetical protein [Pirellulaceae bacterium]MDP6723387.1 hypothetical protein [Pirellulaceae bacterium]
MARRVLLTVFAAWLLWQAPAVVAQQVYVSTPSVNMSDSFYEWFGIDWGFQSRHRNGNFFFNRGSSQGTIPRFGGFDPASAARLGFTHQGANNGFFFNLTAAQGSNRTITSTTPSVTLSNGAVGSVRDVQMRPFVVGLIPVVGSPPGFGVSPPMLISPLKERLARLRDEQTRQTQRKVAPDASPSNDTVGTPDLVLGAAKKSAGLTLGSRAGKSASTAERGDISVAEIRRRQAARAEAEADDLDRMIEEAKAAELVGRFGAARVRYRQAAAHATGDLRRGLLEKLETIHDR